MVKNILKICHIHWLITEDMNLIKSIIHSSLFTRWWTCCIFKIIDKQADNINHTQNVDVITGESKKANSA